MNYDFFHSLENRTVKDLYWLLFKPKPLVSCPKPFDVPFFPEEIIKEWEPLSCKFFEQLDEHPQDIERFVQRKKNYRLGFYAEALLSYFFQSFNKTELILQNFQIRDEKQTLGEIDFIVKYNERVFHIELAVKYYLLLPNGDPAVPENWIGPSRKDNLHKKLRKVQDNQLGHGEHQSVRKEVPSEFRDKIESYFLFRGQFFKNDSNDTSDVARNSLNYYFLNKIDLDQDMIILQRPNWLSSIDSQKNQTESYSKQNTATFERPQLVKIRNHKEIAFIVPENWND
tara:strand:- start:59879 stop:60730 length:852 start_codon:yes stop_codon:yes gene_type:complete